MAYGLIYFYLYIFFKRLLAVIGNCVPFYFYNNYNIIALNYYYVRYIYTNIKQLKYLRKKYCIHVMIY
jgi:hypothetical protein